MIIKKKKIIFLQSIFLLKFKICLQYIDYKIKNNNKVVCFDVDKCKIRFEYIVYVDFYVVIEIKFFFLNFKIVGIGKSNF